MGVAATADNLYLCYSERMTMLTGTELAEADQRYVDRAAAHVAEPSTLRRAQRFHASVTELATARIMLALERGVQIRQARNGRWTAPAGDRLGVMISPVIQEMIRTGLLRDYRDPRTGLHSLIPAKTHLDNGARTSMCLFAGEDLGPMRARLVRSMDLVDCLNCEDAYRVVSRL